MKYGYAIVILLQFLSCKTSSVSVNVDECDENIQFKEKFFSNVNYIEANITIKQDEKFKKSLVFLSEYVHVSFDKMANYANTYPLGVFKEDKKGWLEWYEKNKCNNIQIISPAGTNIK